MKQFAHSQLEQYTNLLVQQVQASIYGGGWTPLTDGRFLRPQGSWNNLGGENKHKLTVAEMPSHSHTYFEMQSAGNWAVNGGVADSSMVFGKILLTRATMPHTITFPHTEHVTAGIELPNILGGVLC